MSPQTFAQYERALLAEQFTGHIIVHYLHGVKKAVQRPQPAAHTPLVERRQVATIPLDDVVGDVHIQSAK